MKPEAMLLAQAKTLLGYTQGVYFVRINTGLIQNEKNRFYRSAEPGTPDLICCILGKFVAIELKSEKGKQSEPQKMHEGRIQTAQGEYWIIRSLEELREKLRTFIKTQRC